MGNPYDDDCEELNDAEQQKENDEIQEMGKHDLTDHDFPDGRPTGTFIDSSLKR